MTVAGATRLVFLETVLHHLRHDPLRNGCPTQSDVALDRSLVETALSRPNA